MNGHRMGGAASLMYVLLALAAGCHSGCQLGCGSPTPEPPTTGGTAPAKGAAQEEPVGTRNDYGLEDALAGLRVDEREPARRARRWLLAHPDVAHPELVGMLRRRDASDDAASLLGVMGRPEGVDPLLEAFEEQTAILHVIATALARHPDPRARARLHRALGEDRAHAIAAADALGALGDTESDCETLRHNAGAHNARVRYHVVQAALRLDCLTEQRLRSIAADDEDAEVRSLARRALER